MARGVAGKNSVTKYGSKSNPGKGHFFRWEETPGEGVGKCIHCNCRMKLKEVGPRGGKQRFYSSDGKSYSEKEIACKRITKSAPKTTTTKKAA